MSYACQHAQWDWKHGGSFIDNTAGVDIPMSYMDCGTYYFDGIFNLVKFPKGMKLYHGSANLANNVVDMPLGIAYYEPYDGKNPIDTHKLTELAKTSDESIPELVGENFDINAGWFSDPNVAKIYSTYTTNTTLKSNCNQKCIYAYTLKRDIVMFLLSDSYNIMKLLNSIMPTEMKRYLREMFGLPPEIQYKQSKEPFSRIYIQRNRISKRDYDLPFTKWLCSEIIKKYGYSGYASPPLDSTFHKEFHQEFMFCNALKYLKRDYGSPIDWQQYVHEPTHPLLGALIQQYNLYHTTNVNFHAGNLLEHSIWTLLYTEKLVDKYTKLNDENKRLIAYTALIHDIGKMGRLDKTVPNIKTKNLVYFDVPDHPEVGAQYLIKGELPLVDPNTLTITGSLKLFDLTKEMGVNTDKLYIVASMVALHWLYGSEVVSKLNQGENPQYIYDRYVYMCIDKLSTLNLLQYYKQKQYILFMFQGLIMLSIADVLGMQPYGQKRLEEKLHSSINAKSKFFPVTNVSKVYRGNDIFVKSMRRNGIQYGNSLYTHIVNNIDLIASRIMLIVSNSNSDAMIVDPPTRGVPTTE